MWACNVVSVFMSRNWSFTFSVMGFCDNDAGLLFDYWRMYAKIGSISTYVSSYILEFNWTAMLTFNL